MLLVSPDDYSYLWNGSQPGWVLLRISRQTHSIAITFAAGGPTLREVAAVRSVAPLFSAMPPSEAFAALKGKSRVALGEFESIEGRRLAERCKLHGLTVESTANNKSSYLPYNEQRHQCLAIEDNSLAELVYQRAISQGIRVKHIEA